MRAWELGPLGRELCCTLYVTEPKSQSLFTVFQISMLLCTGFSPTILFE